MELLRMIAMFMILVLHARFEGILAVYDGTVDMNHATRFLFEALAIVGVNLFVLISDYFGIRLRKEGVAKLVFLFSSALSSCILGRAG